VLRSPLNFSATPITDYAPPPLLGQHTAEVLAQELGLDEAEIERLRAEKVV
jgi:crotonobetainyl-CoA:carnitine CoA-transferase CaiB-like acyl-CoA transferase